MRSERYIYDALYGAIELPDFIWHIFHSPEFQRLREVRMCNINSLCLTGGANINRYEHCIGVAHLALQCAENWPLKPSPEEYRAIVIAALLHDIGSSAFGHSVQYVLGHRGFQHQSFADILQVGVASNEDGFVYRQALLEPVFFGIPRRLSALLTPAEVQLVGEYIDGRGSYGPLISGVIDLDNIDNVYRLAYHIGLVRSGERPLRLARSLSVHYESLVVEDDAEDLLWGWFRLRQRLYRCLLLNPDEFSAKCMLQEALEIAEDKGALEFRWNDVDFELLEKLTRCTDETKKIVSRLAVGDLYGCVGIYATPDVSSAAVLEDKIEKRVIEGMLSNAVRVFGGSPFKNALVAIHFIKDVNKTERKIEIATKSGRTLLIGSNSHRALVGVFLKNVAHSMSLLRDKTIVQANLTSFVRDWLVQRLGCSSMEEHDLYSELHVQGESFAAS